MKAFRVALTGLALATGVAMNLLNTAKDKKNRSGSCEKRQDGIIAACFESSGHNLHAIPWHWRVSGRAMGWRKRPGNRLPSSNCSRPRAVIPARWPRLILGELSRESDIVALEYHVDYWNRINYGRHGRWVDEFSTPEMIQRQRAYNIAIRDTGSVYTPQMVIDGCEETVGSRRREVRNLVERVRKDDQPRVSVDVTARADGGISISLPQAAKAGADVWLVTFIRGNTTEVVRGENHGKTLTSHKHRAQGSAGRRMARRGRDIRRHQERTGA